jgi:hypothetical protein
MGPSKAFQLLKGASSYELFRRGPKFRLRYPKDFLEHRKIAQENSIEALEMLIWRQQELCSETGGNPSVYAFPILNN